MSDSIQSPTQNFKKVTYDLRDFGDLLKREVMLSLNCHAIGTIQEFDSATQRVKVKISYKKTFMKVPDGTQPNQENVNYVPKNIDYPILINCPIYVLQGGGFNLTFPIAVGDQCSVLFNDRDIDNWWNAGSGVPVASSRLHSFSDGIALVGLNNLASKIENYDTTHALLSKGSTKLGISSSKILAKNAAGKSLNDVLQDLVTNINSLITQTAAITVSSFGTAPNNAAAITAIATQLSATAAEISGLLE